MFMKITFIIYFSLIIIDIYYKKINKNIITIKYVGYVREVKKNKKFLDYSQRFK